MAVSGLHHITAFASDPQENHRFWTEVMGLRLVKKTVNFDAPNMYHLYFGDEAGSPGTLLTFFPRPSLKHGKIGTGQVSMSHFSVPEGSFDYWAERVTDGGGMVVGRREVFGEERLICADPDGLRFALEAQATFSHDVNARADVPAEYALRGICGVTLMTRNGTDSMHILTDYFGYHLYAQRQSGEGRVFRFANPDLRKSEFVDVIADPTLEEGVEGAGIVHHVAFRIPDHVAQEKLRDNMMDAGLKVTDVRDRTYFTAIYSRTQDGILFEVATDPPGFAVDEPADELGENLCLPPMHESKRDKLKEKLVPLG